MSRIPKCEVAWNGHDCLGQEIPAICRMKTNNGTGKRDGYYVCAKHREETRHIDEEDKLWEVLEILPPYSPYELLVDLVGPSDALKISAWAVLPNPGLRPPIEQKHEMIYDLAMEIRKNARAG